MRGILFLLILSALSLVSGQIIPEGRRIQWDPGVPGGIPDIQGSLEDITQHGGDNTGSSDCSSAFQSALDALPSSGGVVFFPEGDYRFTSGIEINRDSIVLRGEGADATRLLFDTGDRSIDFVTYERGEWQELVSDYRKGSNTVTVTDGSVFSPGEFAEIQQDNDPDIMYTSPDWDVSWAENSVGQLFEVESVSGNQVTFRRSLNINFRSDLNPVIRPQGFIDNCGIEDLYIEKLQAGDDHTIQFKNSAYCWVRGVESYHTLKCHVTFAVGLGSEVRGSYFHNSYDYGGGGHGYGVECGQHSTDILVENNVFDSLRHAMIIQVGANGNVYGYNYSINNVQGSGETNLNDGWIPPDISIHGHYPFMNLFEGNYVQEIGIGDYWGPAGPGNTFFRNSVNQEGILYYDHSDSQNVIGNETTLIEYSDGSSEHELEHGNVVDGSVSWDPDISDHDLPDSYYLDSKPGFFGTGSWPVYGPDISGDIELPAQTRFEQGEPVTSLIQREFDKEGEMSKAELEIKQGRGRTEVFNLLGQRVLISEKGFMLQNLRPQLRPGAYLVSYKNLIRKIVIEER